MRKMAWVVMLQKTDKELCKGCGINSWDMFPNWHVVVFRCLSIIWLPWRNFLGYHILPSVLSASSSASVLTWACIVCPFTKLTVTSCNSQVNFIKLFSLMLRAFPVRYYYYSFVDPFSFLCPHFYCYLLLLIIVDCTRTFRWILLVAKFKSKISPITCNLLRSRIISVVVFANFFTPAESEISCHVQNIKCWVSLKTCRDSYRGNVWG